MKKSRFSIADRDERLVDLLNQVDKKTAAVWAIACAERVLVYFEERYPRDSRPRNAIRVCWAWIKTGEFEMPIIREAALASHAAAREVGADDPARSAARSAGHAVATAHVFTHALAAANYALQAIYRANDPANAASAVIQERQWQYHYLLELKDEAMAE